MDGYARLWELSSGNSVNIILVMLLLLHVVIFTLFFLYSPLFSLGNCLNNYKPNKLSRPHFLPTAVFSHTEDYGE